MTFPVIPEYPKQHLRNLHWMRIILYILFGVEVFANAVYWFQAENPHICLSLFTGAVPLLLTLIIYLAHRNYLRQSVCFSDSDVRFIGRTEKTLFSIPYESITGVDLHYMKIA